MSEGKACGSRRGTDADYQRHRRAKEAACCWCLRAHTNKNYDWYLRRGFTSHKAYKPDCAPAA